MLRTEVIGKDLCEGCGLCAGTCKAISITDHRPELTGQCVLTKGSKYCGRCYELCPQAHPELVPEEMPHPLAAVSLKSKNEAILKKASNGGFVTTLLQYLLNSDLIDSAAAVTGEKDSPTGVVVSNPAEVVDLAGTRYSASSVLTGLVQSLKKGRPRLAVVGLPCEMRGVHRLESILGTTVLKIGLFCSNNTRVGSDGKKEKMPSCDYCTDFVASHADISCGFSGSQAGFTTVLALTERGANLLKDALGAGLFEEGSLNISMIEKSQKRKATREPALVKPEVRTSMLEALREMGESDVISLSDKVGVGADELLYHLLVLQQEGLVQSIEDRSDKYKITWSATQASHKE
jgi:coenzyme F420-reducing hydrogenase beta subunit